LDAYKRKRCSEVLRKLREDFTPRELFENLCRRNLPPLDLRFFDQRFKPLFPAVDEAASEFVKEYALSHPNAATHGLAYEAIVRHRVCDQKRDLFFPSRTARAVVYDNTDFPTLVDLSALTNSSSGDIVWLVPHERFMKQPYFDFIRCMRWRSAKGAECVTVGFVQCCGCRHRDTYADALGQKMRAEFIKLVCGLNFPHVKPPPLKVFEEYVWLLHTRHPLHGLSIIDPATNQTFFRFCFGTPAEGLRNSQRPTIRPHSSVLAGILSF
jgi:hypothetical protein